MLDALHLCLLLFTVDTCLVDDRVGFCRPHCLHSETTVREDKPGSCFSDKYRCCLPQNLITIDDI